MAKTTLNRSVRVAQPPFERSVFINCPFDEAFAPILQAIAFCVVFLGFFPRLAPENRDNAASRLEKIVELIKGSKYGIHDLSRCQATSIGQYSRMNMPFELGMDHACKRFGNSPLSEKVILILEQERFDYQKSLSDIAGWDIQAHQGDFAKAVRHVRTWLVAQPSTARVSPSKILGEYLAFQEWYWKRELAAGSSEEDIREYPTVEVIEAMHEWKRQA
ncbi:MULTISPECIES: hypothetical protein [unclassified Rhizobium]|uniref:hypothetical protein n=1 Tax=unclassified Rhizobium TaxID=2613769 RepID=UPI001ADB6C53|nr:MULTISPECIES: hypothetical protein [unclassified Rhizobium]MBO9097936.1 hypothetical protein [Rhizobium sp. L58/93]MBO9133281.1 hypothetical protein [Rhizobium sp. B209b/85]MBO9168087.1 hypothetical protein [Rhizobium sp. L245/93]MBO9184132.1 hypothetical protein [Rhizobium sp. E27B/91]QXZ85945.1 hypothetical protein J5287_01955 [Rhizobium sp. K1/93]